MARWIHLTRTDDRGDVLVNMDVAHEVLTTAQGRTRVILPGGDDDFVEVQQSVGDIARMVPPARE